MRYQMLVRVLHGEAGTAEQCQSAAASEDVRCGELRDRHAFDDTPSRYKRRRRSVDAPVEKLRDIGMMQLGADAPFGGEQRDGIASASRPGSQELDRHGLREQAIAALAP